MSKRGLNSMRGERYKKSVKIMDKNKKSEGLSLDELVTRSEIQSMTFKLNGMQRENDKMRKSQEMRYNSTVESVENLRAKLEKAKGDNATFLGEISDERDNFDRLKMELVELKSKFIACRKELQSLRKENQVWDDTKELLKTSEGRCRRLTKINSSLKTLLLQHNIDPDPCTKSKNKVKPFAQIRKPINAIAVRRKLSPNKVSWT